MRWIHYSRRNPMFLLHRNAAYRFWHGYVSDYKHRSFTASSDVGTICYSTEAVVTYTSDDWRVPYSPVHTGDYSRRYRRLSPNSATVAVFGDSRIRRLSLKSATCHRKRQLSPKMATVAEFDAVLGDCRRIRRLATVVALASVDRTYDDLTIFAFA